MGRAQGLPAAGRREWGGRAGASSCQRRVRRLEDLCLRPELRLRVWCLPFVLCLRLVVRCLCLVALCLRLVVFFFVVFRGAGPVVGFAGAAAGGEAAGAGAGAGAEAGAGAGAGALVGGAPAPGSAGGAGSVAGGGSAAGPSSTGAPSPDPST